MKRTLKKRNSIKTAFLLPFAFMCLFALKAQTLQPLQEHLSRLNPVNLFPADAAESFRFSNRGSAEKQPVFALSKMGAEVTYVAEVFAPAKSHGDVQVVWRNTQAIKKGNVLLARFALRANYAKQESGEAVVYFSMQSSERLVLVDLTAGPEWRYMDIPFVSGTDVKEGEATITFTFGALAQKVQLASVQVLNFGNKVTLSQLPFTKLTYAGREENAPWRKEALKRIEDIRTAPFNIKVVDAKGKPVAGASVHVEMLQSDFIWGTAVSEKWLIEDSANARKYQLYLKEFFNTATIGNGLKAWPWHSSEERRRTSMKAFDWLYANGFRQRGHNLVWPGWKFNSKALKDLAEKDTVAFKSFINQSIYERMKATRGRVIAWDVINEMMHEKDFFKYISESEAVRWFQLARQLDPNALLFINEYSMLNSIASPQNIKRYLTMIEGLRQAGAPIDAIGIQGHVGRQPRNPQEVISDLDMFKEMGLPVQITEFDVNTVDEELQADYTRDFLIACYSHPQVTGFTMWGFWQKDHWKPDAALLRTDWTEKPNATVWREWVTRNWKTSFNATSDTKGEVATKGHLGKYEVTVTKAGTSLVKTYQLTKDAGTFQIVL